MVLLEVIFLAGHHWATGAKASAHFALKGGQAGLGNNVERVARVLFTDFLWPFEITAGLLVIAVVGARGARPPQRPARGDGGGRRTRGRDRRRRRRRRARRGSGDGPVTITDTYYLVLAAMIFTIGAVGVLIRRNVLVMFMCIELMLNAVNLTFVAFARQLNDVRGQVFVFFTLVVAAAEVAVGLAIIVAIFRRRRGATADDVRMLKG